MNEVPPNGRELSLRERAELALRLAGLDVIAGHKRTGQPLVIWRDGKVVYITAEEIEKEMGSVKFAADIANGTVLPTSRDSIASS